MRVDKNLLASEASLMWPLDELQFLALWHWLHFSTPKGAALFINDISIKELNQRGNRIPVFLSVVPSCAGSTRPDPKPFQKFLADFIPQTLRWTK